MTCKEMGGTCEEVIVGATPEEMTQNGAKHVEASHPDILAQMKAMTSEQNEAWQAEFLKKWEAKAEEPTA